MAASKFKKFEYGQTHKSPRDTQVLLLSEYDKFKSINDFVIKLYKVKFFLETHSRLNRV